MSKEGVSKELQKIIKFFDKELENNPKIAELLKNKKNYQDVNDYAVEVGKILSTVFNLHLDSNSKDYFEEIVNDRLKTNHRLITEYGAEVQDYLNKQAKISLNAQIPKVRQDKIDGITKRLLNEEFDKIKWILGAPVVTFSQSVVDSMIEKNAKFHYDSGLNPKIVRKESGNCCKWCKNLVGTYKYPDVPKDVYRRHNNCGCTVDYISKDGKNRQNVHNKKTLKNIINDNNQDLPYTSIKKEWLKNYKKPKVSDMNYFEHNGIKYYIDGKNILLDYSVREKEVAEILAKKFGVHVQMVPQVLEPDGVKTPDYLINNKKFDLKEIEGVSDRTFDNAIKNKRDQADNFIFDISNATVSIDECLNRIQKLYKNKYRSWLNVTVLVKDEDIIDVLNRK